MELTKSIRINQQQPELSSIDKHLSALIIIDKHQSFKTNLNQKVKRVVSAVYSLRTEEDTVAAAKVPTYEYNYNKCNKYKIEKILNKYKNKNTKVKKHKQINTNKDTKIHK